VTSHPASGAVWPAVIITAGAIVGAAVLATTFSLGGLTALPTFNACANATSAVMLVTGFALIRRRRRRGHMTAMGLGLTAGTLFLISYLFYHFHAGSVRFTGQGIVRTVYFSILISHTVLAAVTLPLVIFVVWQAARGRFDRHRRVARWTLPMWLYVSVTGVLIYVMLYVGFPS
jgi:uncharacterized membrane protein YozB (DUF420 family)